MPRMGENHLTGVQYCPRCNRANPAFFPVSRPTPIDLENGSQEHFYFAAQFKCTSCHRTVVAESKRQRTGNRPPELEVEHLLPKIEVVDPSLPPKPRQFLGDALSSLNAPTASIMASCSSIDAMLKERGIRRFDDKGKERSLYKRIEIAIDKGVLTKEMARWAHKVRLDANDQRHADEEAPLPTADEARDIFELARGIGEVLFVLPAKIGNNESENGEQNGETQQA